MTEFWVSSGHHLTQRTEGGGLAVTDELLLAYLARPELVPPEEACAAERGALRRPDAPTRAAPSRRRPWRPSPTRMRARTGRCCSPSATGCSAARSIEAAYLGLVRGGPAGHALAVPQPARPPDPAQRPRRLRRPVRAARGRAVLPAAAGQPPRRRGAPGRCRGDRGARRRARRCRRWSRCWARTRRTNSTSSNDENAWTYWSRSDAFSMALNLGSSAQQPRGARPGDRGLRRPPPERRGARRRPSTGSRTPTGAGSSGSTPRRRGSATPSGAARPGRGRRSGARDRALQPDLRRTGRAVDASVGDRPVYLLLAGNGRRTSCTLKPQNLIAGLPLAGRPAAT